MSYARKVDTTHAAVRDTLRALGFQVVDVSRQPGFVDLLAYRPDRGVWLVEAKTPQNKAGRIEKTDGQQRLEDQGWPIVFLRSRDEALAWATEGR